VLPSPNGATLAFAAPDRTLFAGCLRNAKAVAAAAVDAGARVAVIAAGERWPDGSLRPALEDWLGAGAILAHLPSPSADAMAAIDAFEGARDQLLERLLGCPSGQELVERGYPDDVRLAAELNTSTHAPRLDQGAFHAGSCPTPQTQKAT
jgi:2-phosphosulfolactate phosphatase